MHKEMGTNIPILAGQLFEHIDKTELLEGIRMEITGAVETYLPFINLQNITMLTSEDDPGIKINQVKISMSYVVNSVEAANDHLSGAVADIVTFTVTS